jgi:hypothetical protein
MDENLAMSENNNLLVVGLLVFLSKELKATQRSVEAVKIYLIATGKTPEQVKELLSVGEDFLRDTDPIEENFRQFEAQIEMLKAGKDPGMIDG